MGVTGTKALAAHELAALIAPVDSGKYSPRLHQWVKRYGKYHGIQVFKGPLLRTGDQSENPMLIGNLIIGSLDEDCGVLGTLFCQIFNPTSPMGTSWIMYRVEEVTDEFWPLYIERGRCALDASHTGFWQRGEGRFSPTGRNSRTCNWCGHVQTRDVRVQLHEIWR